jgi:hypothetical protein
MDLGVRLVRMALALLLLPPLVVVLLIGAVGILVLGAVRVFYTLAGAGEGPCKAVGPADRTDPPTGRS